MNPRSPGDIQNPSQPQATTKPSIPITLLTGFLGAGKTTVVNALLSNSQHMKIGVVVNEFGALGVDGKLIAGSYGPVVELSNGCVCCSTGEDLLKGLNQMLGNYGELDCIVIETSGLADPSPVVDAIHQGRLARAARIAGVVTVIDAANFDENLERAEAAFRQIVAADLFLINKCDLVEDAVPSAIKLGLSRLNPLAPSISCVRGQTPAAVLLEVERGNHGAGVREHCAHDTRFESAAVWTPRPLDTHRFNTWLDSLPNTIYRAKGLLRFQDHDGTYAFHLVGARRSVEPIVATERSFCSLTLIGENISSFDLQSGFSQCAEA